jgi:hypothetical protein
LEVDDPRIPARIPTRGTQATARKPHLSAYGAITLFGAAFQQTCAWDTVSLRQAYQHHMSLSGFGLNSVVFDRLYSRHLDLISLPPPTEMFQFGGFPILTDHRRSDRKSH